MFGRRSPVLDGCENTIEDEESPLLGDRLLPALALADRLARYGGLFVVLIHAEIKDYKLRFEKALVEELRQRAWFGTPREFAEFWAARDKASVDVERQGGRQSLRRGDRGDPWTGAVFAAGLSRCQWGTKRIDRDSTTGAGRFRRPAR